jgi:hypothetical protein
LSRERPARRSRSAGLRAAAAARGARRGARSRPRLVELLVQRLQHPRGFLAAGHAEVQPRFFLLRDRVGIVVAIVAALAAILLRHRRHQRRAAAAFGELHALGDRHGLVVPRRFAVVAIAAGGGICGSGISALLSATARAPPRRRAGRRRSRSARSALLVGERRVLRNDLESAAA